MVKPIETVYKGYKFRSRLEARWAVAFENMGFSWEYEKEGFDIDGQYYLPDFYIHNLKTFIEIKPHHGNRFDVFPQKSIYLAGKITDNNWRNKLTSDQKTILGHFPYTGPFYRRIHHDYIHGQKLHDYGHGADNAGEVVSDCLEQISKSDIVYAWLDHDDLCGTFVELGYAKALGKEIWIGCDEDYIHNSKSITDHSCEMRHRSKYWFAEEMGDRIYYGNDPYNIFLTMLEERLSYELDHQKYRNLANQFPISVICGTPNINDFIVFEYSQYNLNLWDLLPFPNIDCEKALIKARQARFEHGEKG